jgi:hypothetical protein
MTISYQLLLIFPFLLIGAFAGFRRGWREEAITTAGLLFALIFFGNASRTSLLGTLVNRVVNAFAQFFSTLLGTELDPVPLVASENPGTFQILGYIAVVILAYLVGGVLGDRRNLTRLGRMMGGLFGAINVFLVGSQLFSFINQYFPDFFNRQSTINVTPDSGVNVLRGYLPSVFALLFILLLVILFLRLPKIRS